MLCPNCPSEGSLAEAKLGEKDGDDGQHSYGVVVMQQRTEYKFFAVAYSIMLV